MLEGLMAIVPVKGLTGAKMRLAPLLSDAERIALARRLLKRTLLKLSRARGIARITVISRDPQVLQIARAYGAWSIVESQPDGSAMPVAQAGLNDALEQATRTCMANGARALLVVPVDLPRLRVRDVEKMIVLGEPAPALVIAPARRDAGTNALLLNPAGDFHYAFGDDSFEKHVAQARARFWRVEVYQSDTVTLDLDLPEDYQALQTMLERQPSKI